MVVKVGMVVMVGKCPSGKLTVGIETSGKKTWLGSCTLKLLAMTSIYCYAMKGGWTFGSITWAVSTEINGPVYRTY